MTKEERSCTTAEFRNYIGIISMTHTGPFTWRCSGVTKYNDDEGFFPGVKTDDYWILINDVSFDTAKEAATYALDIVQKLLPVKEVKSLN